MRMRGEAANPPHAHFSPRRDRPSRHSSPMPSSSGGGSSGSFLSVGYSSFLGVNSGSFLGISFGSGVGVGSGSGVGVGFGSGVGVSSGSGVGVSSGVASGSTPSGMSVGSNASPLSPDIIKGDIAEGVYACKEIW